VRLRRNGSAASPRENMTDDQDTVSWREKGVGNWARDSGLVMTTAAGRYSLWSPTRQARILEDVDLDEVEQYLGTL
jgi:hypothetical protein